MVEPPTPTPFTEASGFRLHVWLAARLRNVRSHAALHGHCRQGCIEFNAALRARLSLSVHF
jgi:hypothetical protein